jgi:nickel-dependent lactate racemase
VRVDLSYPDLGGAMIPERNLIGVFEPKDLEAPTVEEAIIRCGLDQPIGTAPLRELVRPGYKVLVIVDDNTRMTLPIRFFPLSRLNCVLVG